MGSGRGNTSWLISGLSLSEAGPTRNGLIRNILIYKLTSGLNGREPDFKQHSGVNVCHMPRRRVLIPKTMEPELGLGIIYNPTKSISPSTVSHCLWGTRICCTNS